jgi:capsular polysaccharide transport system permease protein
MSDVRVSESPTTVDTGTSFFRALEIQIRVIGALLMRELHTRYGRDNIGYLWLVAEPLMFGSVIAGMHSGQRGHEGDMNPVAFAVTGYSIFIIFRGIVNRADGALDGNLGLLYHRMVTVLDIAIARALLELAGTICAFLILLGLSIALGFTDWPARPLYLMLGIFYVFWLSFALSLIITGGTYERHTIGRLVHPATYFSMPISGAFLAVSWIPEPYRSYLLWVPMPHMFETVRYGQFASATLEYVDLPYATAWNVGLTLIGLLMISTVRKRIQLN